MSKNISIRDLPEFDLAEQLKGEDDIAAYLTMLIEEGDMFELAHARRYIGHCDQMPRLALIPLAAFAPLWECGWWRDRFILEMI